MTHEPMTDGDDLDVPVGWTEQLSEDQTDRTVTEFRYETDVETAYRVRVLDSSTSDGFEVRLSTVTPTRRVTVHDYTVGRYDSRKETLTAAEAFIEHLDTQFEVGQVDASDPDVDQIWDILDEYGPNDTDDDSLLDSVWSRFF